MPFACFYDKQPAFLRIEVVNMMIDYESNTIICLIQDICFGE